MVSRTSNPPHVSPLSSPQRGRARWPGQDATETGLTALVFLIGIQAMRAAMPLLVYVLVEREGWPFMLVGGVGLGVFVCGLLAAPLVRLAGVTRTLLVAGGALALSRLALQVWSGDSLVTLGLAVLATAGFLVWLVARLGSTRSHDRATRRKETRRLGVGALLGLTCDSALHGWYGTYDMVWRHDAISLLVVAVLAAALIALLLRDAALPGARRVAAPTWSAALAWAGIGPLLFLHVLVLQNLSRLTVLTGWSRDLAATWMLAGHVIAMASALALSRRWPSHPRTQAAGATLILFGSVLIPYPDGGMATAALLMLGQVAAAMLLLSLFQGFARMAPEARPRLGRVLLGHTLGMILLVGMVFAYSVHFLLPLFPSDTMLLPMAAAMVGVAAWLAGVGADRTAPTPRSRSPLWVALVLLLPLVVSGAARQAPVPAQGDGWPVRVMTYNIHNGFNTQGILDLEAVARVIEQQEPDVVALQETTRGLPIHGCVDALSFLSLRLKMPYVYGSQDNRFWGYAVLSRFPITSARNRVLPPVERRRGVLQVRIDVGGGQHLDLLATHLHDIEDEGEVREVQARALVDVWQGADATIVLGDLNAEPETPEMATLRHAGLVDAQAGVGSAGLTWPAQSPQRRIDYIWTSPDLRASDVTVPVSQASDHLGVVATIRRPAAARRPITAARSHTTR